MHHTTNQLLDMDALEARLPELRDRYAAAQPYPHIVLDDLLPTGVIETIYQEFADIPAQGWTNYLHMNERKYGNTDLRTWGPTMRVLHDDLSSDRFVAFVSELTGIPDLMADDMMDGGGLHRSMAGGFLNVHADFSAHHGKPGWRRRVNLLLYLNPDWKPEWGGELQMWSKDMQRCVNKVEPLGNRVLFFTTDDHSYHGHPEPLRFPEGTARQSLALYYFTHDDNLRPRSTDYRSRPGDGPKAALIYLDKKALVLYDAVKRRLHLTDGAVSRALGAVFRGKRDKR